MVDEFSFDFVGNDNDPFPEGFGFGILRDVSGVESVITEPNPNSFFFIQSDRAFFNFTETVAGPQTDTQGLLATPGFLSQRNAELSICFDNPLPFLNTSTMEEFQVLLGLGLRGKDKFKEWVGVLLETFWTSGGGFSPEWRLSVVRTDGSAFTLLESSEDGAYRSENSLTVRVEGSQIKANFNGILEVESQLDFFGDGYSVLFVKTVSVTSSVISPFPIISKINGLGLADPTSSLIEEAPTQYLSPPNEGYHGYAVPVKKLELEGKLERIGLNVWRFKEDVLVEVENNNDFFANAGSVIIAPRLLHLNDPLPYCRFDFTPSGD